VGKKKNKKKRGFIWINNVTCMMGRRINKRGAPVLPDVYRGKSYSELKWQIERGFNCAPRFREECVGKIIQLWGKKWEGTIYVVLQKREEKIDAYVTIKRQTEIIVGR